MHLIYACLCAFLYNIIRTIDDFKQIFYTILLYISTEIRV